MNKDHVRFLVSGILFGFLVGYIVAYGIYEPRVKEVADTPPEAGNLGMTGAAIGPSGMGGGSAPAGGPQGAAPSGDATMAMVLQEISDLKQRIEKDPKDVEALTHLGNFFQDAGKYDQAIDYYRRALAIRPKEVNTRTDMGICLRESGKPDEAIAEFRRSLEDDPAHWQTWLNLAIVSLYDKRDPATAASALGRVEALNPSHPGLPALREAIKQARGGA